VRPESLDWPGISETAIRRLEKSVAKVQEVRLYLRDRGGRGQGFRVRQEEEQGALVTGEDFRSDFPPRLERAWLFHHLKPYLRKENLLGATVEEVTTLALESAV